MIGLKNFRGSVRNRWRGLGKFNQILVLSSVIFILALSITSFFFAKQTLDTRNIKCLAMNVYHEARGEPALGQYAVAVVTMNRVNSDRYPEDVCHVVYQKAWSEQQQKYIAAFSWTIDELEDIPDNSEAWLKALNIATEVYEENVTSRVQDALFYHAEYVKPYWAGKKLRITKIGRHIFYK